MKKFSPPKDSRTCKICNKIFQPKASTQKYCDECTHPPCPKCGKRSTRMYAGLYPHYGKYRKQCHECYQKHFKETQTHGYNWKGGRVNHGDGYILVYAPEHPRARNSSGYVLEHILVWERYFNQVLPPKWVIHHLNGVRDDNRPENLLAMPRKDHHRNLGIIPYQKHIKTLEKRIKELEKELQPKIL